MCTNSISLCKEAKRIKITAKAALLGKDIQITIGGGSSHIGAICLARADKSIYSTCINGHKDLVVASPMALAVAGSLNCNVLVCAGIHYDDIKEDEICQIKQMCNDLTFEIINHFQTKD